MMIGASFGRYRIDHQLGEGGMAIVYKAFDAHLETYVALKVIRRDWLLLEGKDALLARFEAEAKRVARLSHPNIIPILDYGQYDDAPYLVMKFIPGGTLKERLGSPMPWREAARLLSPVARALSYAHRQGLIHRDVKPANILLNETGEPMLSDFGLSKILFADETRTDLTGTSVVLGTPEYMAPEQALGKPLDHRVDIYALGLVFFEMVTGRKPFSADTPIAFAMKHITEPIPEPRLLVPGLPDAVDQALKKALAKDPSDRFADASAFAAVLEQIASGNMGSFQAARVDVAAPPASQSRRELAGQVPPPIIPRSQTGPAQPAVPPAKPLSQPGVSTPFPPSQPVQTRRKIPVLVWAGLAAALAVICLLAASGGVAVYSWLPGRATSTAPAALPSPTRLALVESTATPIPPRPTLTALKEKATATPAVDAQATERALNRAARTATAQARVDEANSGMSAVIDQLKQMGVIQNTNGSFHAVDNFSQSWAQLGWYQYWGTGLAPTNFVVRAHTEWESASRTADWYASGCGFVFYETDVKNHYLVYLALDGNVYLKGYVDGQFYELGKEDAGKVDNMQGSAEVILVVNHKKITYLVNDKQVLQREISQLSDGNLNLTVVSGTNKDFGTRCKMTGIEVWDLGK